MIGLASILFYALFIFGIASAAYRSPFWGDQAVFGIFAGVAVLIAIKAMVPLSPRFLLIVYVVKSSMLTVAALASLSVLVGLWRSLRSEQLAVQASKAAATKQIR